MRLKVTDKEAKNVLAVFINDKHVKMPVEFDTKEGWVKALVPKVPKLDPLCKKTDMSKPSSFFEYEEIVLKGEVKIIYEDEHRE